MPRATLKRRQKSQLLFVEQPRCGSRHDYGPQLRSAVNPRSFGSEQSRAAAPDHSWVSPQFTTPEDLAVRCGGPKKKKNKKKNQLPASTFNRTSLSTQVRRSAVCKYPALLFDTSGSAPLRCRRGLGKKSCESHGGSSTEIRPPQGQSDGPISVRDDDDDAPNVHENKSASGAEVKNKHSSFESRKAAAPRSVSTHTSTPETSSILSPPRIETPETPHCEYPSSASVLGLVFSPDQPGTPPRTENVLVRDTPERDYGLKVTWRRRKKLMRLLSERGQLLHTEAMISNQWPEVV